MYKVSDAYEEAINSGEIRGRVGGDIKLKTGEKISVEEENILNGSLSIDNKCVSGSDFGLGAVYAGKLSVTLFNVDVSRLSFYGAEVKLSYFLTLKDGTEEVIPLGIYHVTEAKKTRKLLRLDCYDAMILLDKKIEEDTFGTSYALLSYACEKTGVKLKTAEKEINDMVNGKQTFSVKKERIGTFRNLVSYVATALCGFATINREGFLELRRFARGQNKLRDISASRRISSVVSDFETYFRSVTARFIAKLNFYPYTEKSKKYKGGVRLNIGNLPIVQGLEDVKRDVLRNIVEDLDSIRYTPCELKMVGDPSIEVGDWLTLRNVNGTDQSIACITTGIRWIHHGEQTITSYGSDPHLPNVSDKGSRILDEMSEQLSSKDVVVKTYTNAEAFKINEGDKRIISLSWSASVDTTAIFIATIPIEINNECELVLSYRKGVEPYGTLVKYLPKGMHFITISNYIPSKANGRITFSVFARVRYYESDSMKDRAKIVSLIDWVKNQSIVVGTDGVPKFTKIYDEQVPQRKHVKAEIVEATIRAVVFAQGLNASQAWSGEIELLEELKKLNYGGIRIAKIEDSACNIVTKGSTIKGLSEKIEALTYGGMTVVTPAVAVVFNESIKQQTVTFSKTDSLTLVSADYNMTHSTILGIEKVICRAEGFLVISVSFDLGVTWKLWNGSKWAVLSEEGTGMSVETVNGMTAENWNAEATTGRFRFKVSLADEFAEILEFTVDYLN